jgi:voltage-gated potassium channel
MRFDAHQMVLFLVASRWFSRLGRYRVRVLIATAVGIVFVSAAVFSLTQHYDYGTSLYWAVTTATTVGYGDVLPHDTIGRIIAVAVMLTTIPIVGAVFALLAGASALSHVRRFLGLDTTMPTTPHILVFGSHPVLPRALVELGRGDDPIVLVAGVRPPGTAEEVHLLAGDPTDDELIRRSEPHRACRALIACEEDADTLVVAVAIHSLAPDLEVYALTQSPRVARALNELGVTHTLASDELVGHALAKSLETPQAGDLLLQLVDNSNFRLRERPVDPALISQPLSKARQASGLLVLGISRGDQVDLGVGEDPVLAEGDKLIVLEAQAAKTA